MVAYSFKSRFAIPISVGLGQIEHIPNTEYVPKRQTIRANGKRRHARPGETLQLYYGMRTRQCRKIGDARCTEAVPVIFYPKTGAILLNGKILTARQSTRFAKSDGFMSIFDMMAFWQKEHPGVEKFEGTVIRWEPIK